MPSLALSASIFWRWLLSVRRRGEEERMCKFFIAMSFLLDFPFQMLLPETFREFLDGVAEHRARHRLVARQEKLLKHPAVAGWALEMWNFSFLTSGETPLPPVPVPDLYRPAVAHKTWNIITDLHNNWGRVSFYFCCPAQIV